MSVLTARTAVESLERQGIDAEPALRSAELSRAALVSLDNRVPYERVMRLWETSALAARDPFFGIHTAESLPPGAFDVVEYIAMTSVTVGEALDRVSHYVRLLDDYSTLRLIIEPGDARLIRLVPAPGLQYDEFVMALIFLRCQQSSGVHWKAKRISFPHERRGDASELARLFGCPVTFGAPEIELRFSPSVLALPQKHSDSRLLGILLRYADSLLAALPERGDLIAVASSTIARNMARGLPSLQATAASLRMPGRTLQRRLAREGTTHSTLVDEVRRDLALKYMGDAALSIGEIAYLLHFSDSATFYRAFRRWTGAAPSEYRRRLF
jgi:AraC-like DNA-binding protein